VKMFKDLTSNFLYSSNRRSCVWNSDGFDLPSKTKNYSKNVYLEINV